MNSDLSKLLAPKSVAIVGVSENESRIGGRLLKYLCKHGYQGELALVNPKYRELKGRTCYPSITAIPFAIDCALVAVPFNSVYSTLEECAERHISSAVIYSAGFAEMGDKGRLAQQKLKFLAEEKNIRICGPNCIGIVNFTSNTALSFSQFLEMDRLRAGNIGFISQSGALGGSIVNRAQDLDIGISCFVSSGNEADLDVSDYIRHMVLHDNNTEVIAAVIEGFKNGQKFIEAAETALAHRKPLIVLKIGETDIGKKAASSHTGSMTGTDDVIDAVFRQKGVIRVCNYDELFQTAALFAKKRVPQGNRVGIISASGGAGIIMADTYAKLGLVIPAPSENTIKLASKEIASFGQVSNPFDLTGQIFSDPKLFERCFKFFIEDVNFDVVQVNMSMVAGNASIDRAHQLLSVAETSQKPIVVWWAAGSLSDPGIKALNGSVITSFRSPERCAVAVKSLVNYHHAANGESVARGRTKIFVSEKVKAEEIFEKNKHSLSEHDSKALLKLYGIKTTEEKVVDSVDSAIAYAEDIGYPVALKVDSPDIMHKTEANVVRLNVRDRSAVKACYAEILSNAHRYDPNARINGVTVQEMVPEGLEIIAGMSQDPQFGPVIIFGLGGIFVEAMKDIARRVNPLSKKDAEEMVREIKGYHVLNGYRNKTRYDIEAVIDMLQRLSQLSNDHSDRIAEIDINPLVVFKEGKGLKALDALFVLK